MGEEALTKLQSLWLRRLLSGGGGCFPLPQKIMATKPLLLPDSRNTSAGARCNPFRTEVCSRFWSGAVNGHTLCSLHFSTPQRFQEGIAEVGQAVSGPLLWVDSRGHLGPGSRGRESGRLELDPFCGLGYGHPRQFP